MLFDNNLNVYNTIQVVFFHRSMDYYIEPRYLFLFDNYITVYTGTFH